jgi:hypothetical protein
MSGLRQITSRGARLASNPAVPRLHHRHQKIGLPHLVRNRQATSMLLPRALPIRRIPLLPNRTAIRLTKRRRTRRRISCPRTSQLLVGFLTFLCRRAWAKPQHFARLFQAGGTAIPAEYSATQSAQGMGKTALMTVPGLPAATSNWPPNCKTRSRIPAIPTPSFLFFFGSSSVASDGIPLP